ncbi:hypothetical protein D9613_001245 [Agrocybe pediades]|uniref:CCHC-type domain-containing protein n=1 Tax=Agrocybe pediades TaxID=84607 RepID=A0A8H4VVI3_9AGAR|nr:hypothetical protein D9613_001245 [Agrocybe pediades]
MKNKRKKINVPEATPTVPRLPDDVLRTIFLLNASDLDVPIRWRKNTVLLIDPDVSFNTELEFGELPYPQSVYTTPRRISTASVPSDSETASSSSYDVVSTSLRPASWPIDIETASSTPFSTDITMSETPAAPPAPAATMPAKNHSSSPKFDGKAANLQVFLDEVEGLAKACKLTDQQTIEWAIRYSPLDSYELWSSRPTAKGNSWKAFKEELYPFYPGSAGERRYSVANLETFVEKQAMVPITNGDQFGAYYRMFTTMSDYLLKKEKLSNREISSMFIRGFDYTLRTQVREQLSKENPKQHTDDPFTLKQIYEAAIFVISNSSDGSSFDATPATPTPAIPAIKRETIDASSIGQVYQANNINIGSIAAEIIKQLGLQPGATLNLGNPPVNSNNNYRPNTQPRVRSNDCAFCSDPNHYQNNCPKATEYIQKGLCARNNENFIVLPNGLRVTPRIAAGRNIMERIDNWTRANPSPAIQTVSSNFVAAEPVITTCCEPLNWAMPSTVAFSGIEEVDDDAELLSTRELEELQMLEALIATTQEKVDETRKKAQGLKGNRGPASGTRSAAAKKTAAPTNDKPKPQEAAPPKQAPSSTSQPQFKYATPIEDSKLVTGVLDRALDAPITITNRELLALAPDIRKQVKELITTKRTPTSGNPLVLAHMETQETETMEVFMAGLPDRDDGVIVANHTEELRAIDVVIEGITVEGVCDTGSQIVCLRKDVWEKINVPVRSDHVMLIESANESTNSTIGLLHNLKITIGGYDFYVQAQVVENAPYEMLIGLPLLTYTESVLKLFKDGSMHVTFTDPNTGIVVTTPTRRRIRRTTHKCKAKTAGF